MEHLYCYGTIHYYGTLLSYAALIFHFLTFSIYFYGKSLD